MPTMPTGEFWMLIGACLGCEWLANGDNEWYTLAYSFEGDEYGESTYHYEQRTKPVDSYFTAYEELTSDKIIPASLTEGQTIHMTFVANDDDANRTDGRVAMWSTSSGLVSSWLAQGDWMLEPFNPAISWSGQLTTSVESESWGRIICDRSDKLSRLPGR